MTLKKLLLTGGGFLFLLLGGIGLFVPVLPTTPFVLLSAGCFSVSSPGIYRRLAETKYIGEFISNYKTKDGVAKGAKIRALVFLYVTLGISIYFIGTAYIKVLLMVIACAVTFHILLMKTKEM